MTTSINQVAADIAASVSRILETDGEMAAGYSTLKARVIAQYALLIGEAHAAGDLNEEEFQAELEELDRMAERFVRNIRALAHTAVERLFESVSTILRAAAGVAVGPGTVPPALRLP